MCKTCSWSRRRCRRLQRLRRLLLLLHQTLKSIESNESTQLDGKSTDSIDRLDSLPTVYRPVNFSLHNFSWAACFSSSCLLVCHNHVLCSWLLDNSQTSRLARSPDLCAKTTGRIELQFGVLIGLGQCVSYCHFVLDGVPSQIGRPWRFLAKFTLGH